MVNESIGYLVGDEGRFYTTDIGGITRIDNNNRSLVHQFLPGQNFPNPFNPTTTIQYTIPKESFVTITVYNVPGKEISMLVNERKSAKNYTFNFNAANFPVAYTFTECKQKTLFQPSNLFC